MALIDNSQAVECYEDPSLNTCVVASDVAPVHVDIDLSANSLRFQGSDAFMRVMRGDPIEAHVALQGVSHARLLGTADGFPVRFALGTPADTSIAHGVPSGDMTVGMVGTALLFALAIWRHVRNLLKMPQHG